MKKSLVISLCATALLVISAKSFTTVQATSEVSVSTQTQTVTSKWGTASVTFDPTTGTLHVENGVLFDYPISEAEKNSEFIDAEHKIARQDVKNILFGERVSANNSMSLWQLDGSTYAVETFQEDFAHFDNLTFILGDILNPKSPDPLPFGAGFTHDVYRAYNPNSGDHLYTMSKEEFDGVVNVGWKNEGVAYLAYDWSTMPIYRAYNPNSGEHMFTTSKEEYFALYEAQWIPEGYSFGAAEKGTDTKAVYRAFNPNTKGPGSHLFTDSQTEIDQLVQAGWKNEGTAYFVPTVSKTEANE